MTKSARLVGYATLEEGRPAFALPIFQNGNSNFIQIVDQASRSIVSFERIKIDTMSFIDPSHPAGVGDPAWYVFVEASAPPVIGALEQISDRLRPYIWRQDVPLGTSIQIATILNDNEKVSTLRAAFAQRLAEQAGTEAWRAYMSSTIRAFAWNRLTELVETQSSRAEITARLSDLDFFVNEDNAIAFRSYGPSLAIDNRFLHQVIEEARAEFSQVLKASMPMRIHPPRSGLGRHEQAVEIVRQLRASSRQETRAAMLFRYAALEPKAIRDVIRKYNDRGKIARWSMEIIDDAVSQWRGSPKELHAQLAEGLRYLFSASYSRNRGILLYQAAKFLYDIPELNSAIWRITARSRSSYVYAFRKRIEDVLGVQEGRPRHLHRSRHSSQLDLFDT